MLKLSSILSNCNSSDYGSSTLTLLTHVVLQLLNRTHHWTNNNTSSIKIQVNYDWNDENAHNKYKYILKDTTYDTLSS